MIALKSSAHENPATAKPGTIQLVRSTVNALIANVKRPNVRNVMGNARNLMMGRIIVFTTPRTNAAVIATQTFATVMPGNTYGAPKKITEITSQ
jgi:hypothetical protein